MNLLKKVALIALFSQSIFAGSFLCAENAKRKYVVRVVSDYSMTLSGYNGFDMFYSDVEFEITDQKVRRGTYSFMSGVESPDGEDVTVELNVFTDQEGNPETAKWMGIQFFPKSTKKAFAAEISVSNLIDDSLEATCIAL